MWTSVYLISALQLGIAIFAVYSSNRNILSDGACIGGIFGTLANFVILAAALVVIVFLGVKSLMESRMLPALEPLLVLAFSSTAAIAIGQYAALRCTV